MKQHSHTRKYLETTSLLDYKHVSIQQLIADRGWNNLPQKEKIMAVYNFVRDEILFAYNKEDSIVASEVLKEGYGQCNTKSILLMALLRATGTPSRIHGFNINKSLKKGTIPAFWYNLAPKEILHTWVEISYNNQWYNLEGVILDKPYLNKLQQKFNSKEGKFCGFGAFTENLKKPPIDWDENDTYIQHLGISEDFGLFDSPDKLFEKHQQKFNFILKWTYQNFIRKTMNKKIKLIREGNF